ncbi:MAG: Rid family detoxifying hydrolase [Solirubrobacteraceae bacterium]
MRQIHTAQSAPQAIGPYSHAVSFGGVLYCSGQLALHPESGEMVGNDAAVQARQSLENLAAVCEAAGTSLARALRLGVYVVDLESFAQVNDVYGEFFTREPPARVLVEVAGLPRGGLVEIDALVAI